MTQPCPECDAASPMTKELITDDGYRETARRDYRCPACGHTFFYIETVNPRPIAAKACSMLYSAYETMSAMA